MTSNPKIKKIEPGQDCLVCYGTGYAIDKYHTRKEVVKHKCKICKGTGKRGINVQANNSVKDS